MNHALLITFNDGTDMSEVNKISDHAQLLFHRFGIVADIEYMEVENNVEVVEEPDNVEEEESTDDEQSTDDEDIIEAT